MLPGWTTYYLNGNQYFKHTDGLIVVWQGCSAEWHGGVKVLKRPRRKVN